MPAFGPMLLACLTLALAAPAGASAAAGEVEDCDGSRASNALGEGACEGGGSRSRAALAEDSASSDADHAGDGTQAERKPSGEGKAGEIGRSLEEELGARAEAIRREARARRAVTRRRARSLEEELDARAEAIRREARARGSATLRRTRSAKREDASSDPAEDRRDAKGTAGEERDRGDEITVSVAGSDEQIRLLPGRRDILVRRRALVRGYIPARRAGREVVLEVLSGGRWVEVDRAETVEDGRFYLAWHPRRPGYFRVRVRPDSTTTSTQPSKPRLLYVYRTAVASWYGPGLYGNRTACGQTFSSRLLGVAHRSLPCGHRLTVRYRGRARTVTVVDRGPYVDGRDYDLTEALRDYLRFDGVDEVWVTA